jgi:hypothetical protein
LEPESYLRSGWIGGFDLVIVKAEPPELQMRMFLETVVPARTFAKSIAEGFEKLYPSRFEIEIMAIGAVLADPVSRT